MFPVPSISLPPFIPPVIDNPPVPGFFYSLINSGIMNNAISFFRFPIGVIYVIKRGYENEFSYAGGFGNIMLLPADGFGGYLFIRGLLGLAISSSLIGVLSFLYIGAYSFIAVDSIIILTSRETNVILKRQATLDLANAVLQIALACFAIAGFTHWILIGLAAAAAVYGTLSFLHRYRTKAHFSRPHSTCNLCLNHSL